ncbi:MAG TPA: hypothetical protein VG408_05710 [Actinomycetota bacterium]|nr:hypothetical protein [Actinomycetota bacterium]
MFSAAAVVALVAALAIPAGAKPTTKVHNEFALAGEARALELAIGSQGVTLGMALAKADSAPSAIGVGAGQCTLIGDDPDPSDLPCTEESSSQTNYPGSPGDGVEICGGALPSPLGDIVDLRVACGSSKSGVKGGLPYTTNKGRVAHLGVTLPIGTVLENTPVDQVVDTLTETLSPILDKTPKEVQDAVSDVVDLIDDVAQTEALAAEVGPASSNVARSGKGVAVTSDAAGALIGILGIPEGQLDGTDVSVESDPLKNGLLIVEVGRSTSSAKWDNASASATGAASAAIVTVKVRDITKPEKTYVTQSVAPGETVTLLAGTPAETTIVAADSTIEEDGTTAKAGASAVRIHALKGVNGGVALAFGKTTSAVNGKQVLSKPPVAKAPPEVLPFTGGIDRTWPALGLIGLAAVAFGLRRRFRSSH